METEQQHHARGQQELALGNTSLRCYAAPHRGAQGQTINGDTLHEEYPWLLRIQKG